jgi:hypothetical protein
VSGVLFVVSLTGSFLMQDVVKKILIFYRIVNDQNMFFDIFFACPVYCLLFLFPEAFL